MGSKAFSGQHPARPHLIKNKRGVAGEVWDTRTDVDSALEILESRDAALEYPELDYIDGAGPAAAGADMAMVGRFLLQGQTFASLSLGASLDIIMRVPGEAGNLESVEVVDVTGAGLVVSYAANKLTIDLGAATPDEDTIATAVNAALVASPMRANSGGGAAFGVVAEANLAGGAGKGWSCTVGGFDAPIKFNVGAAVSSANLDETDVIVTVPALAPIVATDKAKVYVTTDEIRTDLGAVAVE
jgi:hypothetical protein